MNNKYSTIDHIGHSVLIKNKSRFICYIIHVDNEEDMKSFYYDVIKKNYDAKHHCTASIIGIEQQIMRSYDDGEPKCTAGRPMLKVLVENNLTNVAAIVTRYFGGILLGKGRLSSAYSEVLNKAIQTTEIITYVKGKRYKIKTDYATFDKIKNVSFMDNIKISEIVYTNNVQAILNIPQFCMSEVIFQIGNFFGLKVILIELGECYFRI